MFRRLPALTLLATVPFACATPASLETEPEPLFGPGGKADIALDIAWIIDDDPPTDWPRVLPETVVQAEVVEGVLGVRVEYAGGCEEHAFDVFWNGSLVEHDGAFIASLQMTHQDRGDACEAPQADNLYFDLESILFLYDEAYRTHDSVLQLELADRIIAVGTEDAPAYFPRPVIGEPDGPVVWDEDILDAYFDLGGRLVVEVAYRGGCAEHEWTLFWDGEVTESDPPVAQVQLVHRDPGDPCEALSSATLRFDVAEIGGPRTDLYIGERPVRHLE